MLSLTSEGRIQRIVFGNTVLRNIEYLFLERKSYSRLEKVVYGAAASFAPLIILIVTTRGRMKRKSHVTRMGDVRNICRFWRETLTEKAIWKTWVEYIKIYLKERMCEGMAWINLAHKKNSGLLQKISCLVEELPAFQAYYSMESVSLLVTIFT